MTEPVRTARVPHHWLVLATTMLGTLLVFTNTTSINLALPAMSADLDVDTATADWFLLSWMLAVTSMILVFGRVSDVAGRRRTYLAGVGLMVVASLACAVAPTAGILIGLRVLQGIACAATISNTHALVADAFPTKLLPLALSLIVSTASVGAAFGPVVGGAVVDAWDWRGVFAVNVPFGLLSLALGFRVLRDPARSAGPRERFDVPGAVLSAAFLTALLLGINRSAAWGTGDVRVVALLAASVLLLAAFVVVERRSSAPLVDLGLLADRSRRLAYSAAFFVAVPAGGLVTTVALHEQLVVGRSPLAAGAAVVPLPLAQMVVSPIAGALAGRWSARTLSTLGAGMQTLGILGVAAYVASGTGAGLLVVALACYGAGSGMFIAPNTTAILAGVPRQRRGIANAVRSVSFNSAQAIGTAVVLLVLGTALGTGAAGYSAAASDSARGGFLVALLLLAGCPLAGGICSIVRGGPWRLRPASSSDVGAPDVSAPDVSAPDVLTPRPRTCPTPTPEPRGNVL